MDEYNPKKYFHNEEKGYGVGGGLPPHLTDPSSLYRSETAYSGNMIMVQKFL